MIISRKLFLELQNLQYIKDIRCFWDSGKGNFLCLDFQNYQSLYIKLARGIKEEDIFLEYKKHLKKMFKFRIEWAKEEIKIYTRELNNLLKELNK